MKIIVGLGNPGSQYVNTRHNVGFEAIDALAEQYRISVSDRKFCALCGNGIIEGQKALLVKPQTFMNLSGESVAAAVHFFKCNPAEELLILCDDVYLDVGQLRIRRKGSAGGHNGLKNIIAHLGTEEFSRIRIGVGKKLPEYDLVDFVLGHFPKADYEVIADAEKNAACAAADWVLYGIDHAMNGYNRKA